MLFRFHGQCLDCGHEWDGLRRRIVCGRVDFREPDACWCYPCARCLVELYVPRQLSRSGWLRWVSQNASELTQSRLTFTACELGVRVDLQSLDVISRSALLFQACEKISSRLARTRSQYVPVAIDLGDLECPDCREPMAAREMRTAPLVCPRCEHPAACTTTEKHAGVVLVDYSPLAAEEVGRVILHLQQLAEPLECLSAKTTLAVPILEGMGPLWDRQLDG